MVCLFLVGLVGLVVVGVRVCGCVYMLLSAYPRALLGTDPTRLGWAHTKKKTY